MKQHIYSSIKQNRVKTLYDRSITYHRTMLLNLWGGHRPLWIWWKLKGGTMLLRGTGLYPEGNQWGAAKGSE